jgi:hypothetical protein
MRLQIIGASGRFPRAHLVEPPARGYIHLAAVVQPPAGPAPFARTGPHKAELLARLKSLAADLSGQPGVDRVTVFNAVVVPPAGGYAQQRDIHHARYDVAVLVETTAPQTIPQVQATLPYRVLHDAMAQAGTDLHVMPARCIKSMGHVDPSRPGLFLFNYFVAEDVDVALELWDYLAGWYAVQTGLTNSNVLFPVDKADYAFINYARWDHGPARFLLTQMTKPSFRTYVQANLLVNRTGSMPVLYHLA